MRGGFRSFLRFGLSIGLYGFAAVMLFVAWCAWDMPDTSEVKPLEKRPSITILAANGELIARYGGLKGNVVDVKDLPPYVAAAVLSVEDRRFYSHPGVDPIGFARAMLVNIRERRFAQGGSTITQQLAKNLFLTTDKTVKRKVQEAILAVLVELRHSKDEILTAYLNRVYFGSGAYGIDAAARTYFGKSAKDITLWESAVLAGLLKAPSRFSPSGNPKLARQRAKVVIGAMKAAGYIGDEIQEQEIRNAKITLAGAASGSLNRYFSDWVIDQIDSYVSNTERDLVVRTTFVPEMQLLAEKRKKEMFDKMRAEDKVSQMALVTMGFDGAVYAMIGGTDYTESQFNRATQALRQPGSAFKPFVYLAALERGYHPRDIVEDAPITEGSYRPRNYENKYHGPVTLTDALALSLNTATIRLLQAVGAASLLDVVQRLGFSQKFRAELAVGLGAAETTLIETTNAYAEIANGGYAIWPYAVLSIKDGDGRVLYVREPSQHMQIFQPRHVNMLESMLEQAVLRGTAQAAQLSRGRVAGKTGTTQDYRDALFIGYTNQLVTGIWMGNDNNEPMRRVSGGGYPARLWRSYMEDAINVPIAAFHPGMKHAGGDGFSSMLRRWSEGFGGGDRRGWRGFSGSDEPVYNR